MHRSVSQAVVTNRTGPAYMVGWLQGDGGRAYDLPSPYLNQWGALYAPLMASEDQWWRIFTSQFVHYNLVHLAGNAAVLLVLGSALERRHGAWRVALVWVAAVLGGEMLALLAEDPCDQVRQQEVGAAAVLDLRTAAPLPAQTEPWCRCGRRGDAAAQVIGASGGDFGLVGLFAGARATLAFDVCALGYPLWTA